MVYYLWVFYGDTTYKIIRSDGLTLFKGAGYVIYDEQTGLISIRDKWFFAYVDTSGKFIFKISLMNDLPD